MLDIMLKQAYVNFLYELEKEAAPSVRAAFLLLFYTGYLAGYCVFLLYLYCVLSITYPTNINPSLAIIVYSGQILYYSSVAFPAGGVGAGECFFVYRGAVRRENCFV
jgi:hypothetical protein